MDDDDGPRVLFVCLGNICRSPLAKGAFRAAAARRGADVAVDSAGTGDWHVGAPPDPRARAVARENGVDVTRLRARQVAPGDFHRFTHIVAMDGQNLDDLARMRPEGARAALSLLLDHVPGGSGQSVADPYHGRAEAFARTWREVSEGAEALLAAILRAR